MEKSIHYIWWRYFLCLLPCNIINKTIPATAITVAIVYCEFLKDPIKYWSLSLHNNLLMTFINLRTIFISSSNIGRLLQGYRLGPGCFVATNLVFTVVLTADFIVWMKFNGDIAAYATYTSVNLNLYFLLQTTAIANSILLQFSKEAEMYSKHHERIVLFNEAFGYQIVVLVIQAIKHSLHWIEKYLVSGTLYLALTFPWICLILVSKCLVLGPFVSLLVAAEKLKRAERYVLLASIPKIAFHNTPKLSAAGFFDIDYSFLYLFFTMLFNYTIVLIQFTKG